MEVEDETSSVLSAAVYAAYEAWAKQYGIEPESKSWFGRRLGKQVTFERTLKRENGSLFRQYQGITLREVVEHAE